MWWDVEAPPRRLHVRGHDRKPQEAPMSEHDTPTTLYRLYDEGGDLLYVGISTRPLQRVREHSKGQS